ncbi:hypothetical protein [Runella sp.]
MNQNYFVKDRIWSFSLIATDENPLQNIKTLQNVIFVMKDGIVVKQ